MRVGEHRALRVPMRGRGRRAGETALRGRAGRAGLRAGARSTPGVHLMNLHVRRHPCTRGERGFTILEHAVSLSVIALVLGSVMGPLQTPIESRKSDETRRALELAQEMLRGFAAANGYFPCPADGASNGQESLGTDHVTGSCPVSHGFLPAALLGFRPTDAQGYV